MKGIQDTTIEPDDAMSLSALRIPVEWAMLMKQDLKLLQCRDKMKLFQTRPKPLIEMGTLLVNFKLCLCGENITTFYAVKPPTLIAYLQGAVC